MGICESSKNQGNPYQKNTPNEIVNPNNQKNLNPHQINVNKRYINNNENNIITTEKKNKKHNKRNKNKKEENNIEQEEPKELTEEEKFKQELINYTDELKELKNIFDRKNPKKYNEDKIENYFLFEKVINFNNIKQKIKSIFKTENKDIFLFLSHLWNKCIELSKNINEKKINEKTEENSENNDSSEEEESNKTNKSKKKQTNKVLILYK